MGHSSIECDFHLYDLNLGQDMVLRNVLFDLGVSSLDSKAPTHAGTVLQEARRQTGRPLIFRF